jgi:hypothetical protein
MRFLIKKLKENPIDLQKLVLYELQKKRLQQRNKIIYILNSKYMDINQLLDVNIKYWNKKISDVFIIEEKLKSVISRSINIYMYRCMNTFIWKYA